MLEHIFKFMYFPVTDSVISRNVSQVILLQVLIDNACQWKKTYNFLGKK